MAISHKNNQDKIGHSICFILNRLFLLFASVFNLTMVNNTYSQERIQLQPDSFYEINMRHLSLKENVKYSYQGPVYSDSLLYNPHLLLQVTPHILGVNMNPSYGVSTWLQYSLGNGTIIVSEVNGRLADSKDQPYVGKSWRSVQGWTNQSFLRWKGKRKYYGEFSINVGRFYSKLGPGLTGNLLVSTRSRPMDQISFEYKKSINNDLEVKYYNQTSALDKYGNLNRFMIVHRYQINWASFHLAATEAMIFSRSGGIDWSLINPISFLYLEQVNGPNLFGNTLGTIEIGYRKVNVHLYSEFLIDDVQFDSETKHDLEPSEIGVLTGIEYGRKNIFVNAEAIAISNRTYKTPDISEWALHRNQPIGYDLGSDLKRLKILIRYNLMTRWYIDMERDYLARGEGRINASWDTPWLDEDVTIDSGYSESFPTGVVETINTTNFKVSRHWSREKYIILGISYSHIHNKNHIPQNVDHDLQISFGLSWAAEYFKQLK
jgi:hypothetical protein